MGRLPLEKIIEALLFVSGDALPVALIAGIIGTDVPAARNLLSHMAEQYAEDGAGIQMVETDDSFQLCANPDYSVYIQKLSDTPPQKALTPPLLETLSIIAYRQPVTKGVIEEIRGVNADHAVNRLLEYGLVEERGRLDAPGKPILFGTSDAFLRHFGFKSLEVFYTATEPEKANADE